MRKLTNNELKQVYAEESITLQYKYLILQHFPNARTIDCMLTNTVEMYIDGIHVATFDRSWWNAIIDERSV